MLTPNAMVRAVIQFHTTVTMMKWWPKYAERNVQWLNITFIFIMFQNKISYSVSISCLSSFSHLMEDTEKIVFIKEEISLKIKKIICIKRCNLNFRSLLLYFHEVFNWQILCVFHQCKGVCPELCHRGKVLYGTSCEIFEKKAFRKYLNQTIWTIWTMQNNITNLY